MSARLNCHSVCMCMLIRLLLKTAEVPHPPSLLRDPRMSLRPFPKKIWLRTKTQTRASGLGPHPPWWWIEPWTHPPPTPSSDLKRSLMLMCMCSRMFILH